MTRYLLVVFLATLLAACDEPAPVAPETEPPVVETPATAALTQLLNAEQDVHLRRLAVGARGFQDAVDGLLGDPRDERLATAREAWAHLYRVFNKAAVVLLCRAATDPALAEALSRTDLFPILPGYIDGLGQWPGSGIVNDVSVELSRDALLAEQAVRSREEASIGFQVLAFLLFGEPDAPRQVTDLQPVTSPPPRGGAEAEVGADKAGTGDAEAAVFAAASGPASADTDTDTDNQADGQAAVVGAHGQSQQQQWEQQGQWRAADQPANRRRNYLRQASRILVQDLLTLASDRSAVAVGAHCPLDALRRTSERLIRAEGLSGHTDVEGEYYAAASRDIAIAGLRQAMAPWLVAESPLRQLASLPDWQPTRAGDMSALQQLHAALSAAVILPSR